MINHGPYGIFKPPFNKSQSTISATNAFDDSTLYCCSLFVTSFIDISNLRLKRTPNSNTIFDSIILLLSVYQQRNSSGDDRTIQRPSYPYEQSDGTFVVNSRGSSISVPDMCK